MKNGFDLFHITDSIPQQEQSKMNTPVVFVYTTDADYSALKTLEGIAICSAFNVSQYVNAMDAMCTPGCIMVRLHDGKYTVLTQDVVYIDESIREGAEDEEDMMYNVVETMIVMRDEYF